ncbi:MAG: site-specific DNA-methyltransferase, partial [Vampirovibrionales bacterium]
MTIETNPHKLNLASHDVLTERLEALKELFPEVVVEGKVDVERLKQHLGDFSHVGSERYGLNWAGKAEAIRTLQQASYATLTPMRNDSVNFDTSENLIIEG